MEASWDPWAAEGQPDRSIALIDPPLTKSHLDLAAQQQERSGEHADFISILALAQHLRIDFLPIVWHPEIETIGAGATAEIRQALINVQIGLAFKRIKQDREETFASLFSEISILGVPGILEHENIITLEGICWDVNPAGPVVWPVLVFQKADYGSLEDFILSSTGRAPSLEEVLSILADIARGLSCLHEHNIIHGDLKPNNILIFKTNNDEFLAKIADFGYSTQVFDNALLRVSIKQPWADPQYGGEWINFDSAKKMDVYSFGIICAWMMWYCFPFPADSREAAMRKDNHRPKLEDFTKLFDDTSDLPFDLRQVLSLSLEPNRDNRGVNFSVLLRLLGRSSVGELSVTDLEASLNIDTAVPEFKISSIYFRLLQADPRLPGYVVSELRKQAQSQPANKNASNAAFQLALCYFIGFGVRRDLKTAHAWLVQSTRREEELQQEIIMISEEHRWSLKGKVARSLELDGSLHLLDARLWEDETEVLAATEIYYKNLIEDLDQVFAPDHSVVVLARFLLASIYNKSGRYIEALKMFSELVQLMQGGPYGTHHPSTLVMVAEMAGMHFKLGNYHNAEIWYRDALQGQMETLGSQHPDTIKTMIALSQTLGNLGKNGKAEGLITEALNHSKACFGDEHPETLSALMVFCHTLSNKGNYPDAEDNLRKAIAGRERVLGPRSAETMIAKGNLASIYHLQGKFQHAKELLYKIKGDVGEIQEHLHPDSFYLSSTLASIMHTLGENEEAKRIDRQLLEMQDVIGINNPFNLTVKSNLAVIIQEEGDFDQALELDFEILEKRLTLLGKDHPDTLTTLHNIAACFHRKGNYSEAKVRYEEVLKCRSETLGSTHPETLHVRSNLAQVLHDIGEYELAITEMLDIIDASERSVGPLHQSTLLAVNNLGTHLLSIGDTSGAVERGRQAYQGMLSVFGPKHRETVSAMDNLAVALSESQRFEEARQLFEQELSEEHVFEPNDGLILAANHNYGGLLFKQGQLDEAISYLTKAADGRRKTLGETHPQTLDSLHDIALVRAAQQQNDEAAKIFKQVWETRKAVLGPAHPSTLTTLSNLASTVAHSGNEAEAEKLHSEALQGRKDTLGENHPKNRRLSLQASGANPSSEHKLMLDVLLGIGISCQAQEKFSDALQVLKRCLTKAKGIPGKEIFAFQTQARVATVHQDSGDLKSAISTYEEALEEYEPLVSPNDPTLLDIHMNLASALLQIGEAPRALSLFTQAAEESESSLGKSHETTFTLLKYIGFTYLTLERHKEALDYMEKANDGFTEMFGHEHVETQDCKEIISLIHQELRDLISGEQEKSERDVLTNTNTQ
ncbi:hypothetical protein B7463_g2364, partial [Scytalidium lignicola]